MWAYNFAQSLKSSPSPWIHLLSITSLTGIQKVPFCPLNLDIKERESSLRCLPQNSSDTASNIPPGRSPCSQIEIICPPLRHEQEL